MRGPPPGPGAMLTFTERPGPGGPPAAAGALRMPFSDAVKYCILGVSVLLLLLALAILTWQVFRCFSQTLTHRDPDPGHSDLLFSEENPSTTGKYSTPPSTTVEDVAAEAHRLSRCLSRASFPPEPAARETGRDKSDKKVSGSLSFSIYLDQLQSRLVVTVLQVEGLQDYSQTASLQLFVKLRLMCSGSGGTDVEGLREQEGDVEPPVLWTVLQEWRTRIVKGSCRPLFGDQFSYGLQEDQDLLDRLSLRMEVRDFDKFSRHTVLGEVRVPLDRINITYPVELQEDLQTPQKDLVGEVLLSLRFLPTSQRLEVGLLKVRTPVPRCPQKQLCTPGSAFSATAAGPGTRRPPAWPAAPRPSSTRSSCSRCRTPLCCSVRSWSLCLRWTPAGSKASV